MPIEKLESFLEMAIRTSSANADPFKDDVSCELNAYGLIEQLFAIRNIKGAFGSHAFGLASKHSDPNAFANFKPTIKSLKVLESFTLDYKVKWPLTLILSKRTITKYQLIFRHLLYCKYVERNLDTVWLHLQSTKEYSVYSVLQKTFFLRNRMSQFCKNYIYYMVVEVLEPNFHKFKDSLLKATTIDEILLSHNDFLDECLKECLITDQNLFRILTKINQTTHFFSRIIFRSFQNIQTDDTFNKAATEDYYYARG